MYRLSVWSLGMVLDSVISKPLELGWQQQDCRLVPVLSKEMPVPSKVVPVPVPNKEMPVLRGRASAEQGNASAERKGQC